MTFTEAKKISDELHASAQNAGDAVNRFPRGNMGLVSDEVRSTDAYKAASQRYARAFQVLRKFNTYYVKAFKKERREERSQRFAAL